MSSILPVLIYPDPRLKEPALQVEHFDEDLLALVGDLEATMRAGPGTCGIAAPQVGRPLRVAIVDVSEVKRAKREQNHGRLVLVNPEVVAWDGLSVGREGCLSVPDLTGNVVRAEAIVVQASDERGNTWKLEAAGFEARALQHEIDHLDGLLFLDRLVSRRSDLFQRKHSR